jgi:spectinomycin phosphotransferase
LDDEALLAALAGGWGMDVSALEYAPVGFGSYHWLVSERGGPRWFATADDLDHKAWLGATRAERFDGLRRAFDAAAALAEVGLGFVVAPVRTTRGETARRVAPRYAVALFPFVEGRAGRHGDAGTRAERAELVSALGELHRATPVVRQVVRRHGLAAPGRSELEGALRELDSPWSGGPFSEPARRVLAAGAGDVRALLRDVDALSKRLAARGAPWVVTHGEPHAANVIRTGEGLRLVDWDTVALAPPERDLWLVLDRAGEAAATYTELTGRSVDEAALELFRRQWDVADLAAYVALFRSPHAEDADTTDAYAYMTRLLTEPA